MNIEKYLSNIPKLHSWDGGKTWNTGGFERKHLQPLLPLIGKGKRILEAGCGNSTIFFLISEPAELISIDPNPAIFDRIAAYCTENAIDQSKLNKIVEGSEFVLPDLARKFPLHFDFILIDGNHGWPAVMVDFCYTLRMLAPDSYLMIDDIQLHAVKELARLLNEQPGFEIVADLGKALVFRRTGSFQAMPGWWEQKYIARKTGIEKRLGRQYSLKDKWRFLARS